MLKIKVKRLRKASVLVKIHVGTIPIEYLLHWRMQIECNLLEEKNLGVAEVAHEVGYESESAFSSAFNRILGVRPGQYNKSRNH